MSFGSTTGAPTTTSIFGQAASKPAGSLFSGTQPSGTSAFTGFGTQPAQGTSLFGGGQQQQQQQPTSSLFGQPTGGTATQTTPGTSLFGGTPQQQPQTAIGTSFFGSTTQQQPQGTTGPSLFGTATQQQPQAATGTSLFGSTAQPAQPTIGLFGAPAQQQQQPQQGTGFFGSTLQPQPTLSALGTAPSSAGPSLFGIQQSISPVQVSGHVLFSKSTKFNDLPDDVKKKFEALDAHIQGRIQISNELKQRKLGQEATKGQELIREVHRELLSVASMIQSDAQFVRDLKAKTEQAVQDTIVATRIIDGFKNLQQHGAYLKNYASFPLEFFTRVTKEMQERLQWCKNTIEQIERKLSSTVAQQQNTPQAIASTLQAQHAVSVSLAAKTATVDAELQKLKSLYTQLWRTKTGSVRDPFNDLDRGTGGDFGMESLQVK
ncbi:hypothetical protein J3A83DRAFT_4167783 [Scleroderma citrinum]